MRRDDRHWQCAWQPGRKEVAGPGQFMGELTAQVGMSNCKTWHENEFQVFVRNLATNSLVFVPGFAVLFFGKLENSNLSG